MSAPAVPTQCGAGRSRSQMKSLLRMRSEPAERTHRAVRLVVTGAAPGGECLGEAHDRRRALLDCDCRATLFSKVNWLGGKCFAAARPRVQFRAGRRRYGETHVSICLSVSIRLSINLSISAASVRGACAVCLGRGRIDHSFRTGVQSGERRNRRGKQFVVCRPGRAGQQSLRFRFRSGAATIRLGRFGSVWFPTGPANSTQALPEQRSHVASGSSVAPEQLKPALRLLQLVPLSASA
jgi:hypothetical protein